MIYGPTELNADVKRYLELDEQRRKIEAEQAEIKHRLRDLGSGEHEAPCGVKVSVTPQRRFNAERARAVLPSDLFSMCQATVVDTKTAKSVLPPALYESCMIESGVARVVLT